MGLIGFLWYDPKRRTMDVMLSEFGKDLFLNVSDFHFDPRCLKRRRQKKGPGDGLEEESPTDEGWGG